jgi:hypothetical protein
MSPINRRVTSVRFVVPYEPLPIEGCIRIEKPDKLDYSAIREGLCPRGHGPLERREDCGYCETCGAGYSTRPGEATVHLDFMLFPDS